MMENTNVSHQHHGSEIMLLRLTFSHTTVQHPPNSTLFPYTTLFRSWCGWPHASTCSSRASTTSPRTAGRWASSSRRSEEHTSELQSPVQFVCRLLLEKKKFQRLCAQCLLKLTRLVSILAMTKAKK